MTTNFGKKCAELVREIADADDHCIPVYNEDLVREVIDECKWHYDELRNLASTLAGTRETNAEAVQASILTHHESILRNKRALMIYLEERMKRVAALRWTVGVVLPEEVRENLSSAEQEYFNEYSRNLNRYMGRFGVNTDLTLDMNPPKEHKWQCRVLMDRGAIFTKDGEVDLRKDTVHSLWREDAQKLILEGVLEKIDDA